MSDYEYIENEDETIIIEVQTGPHGLSAYQIALNNGFEGTEQEWLESLGGSVSHGALGGLDADDHLQYHNDERGDLRYAALAHDHNADFAPAVHEHDDADINLTGNFTGNLNSATPPSTLDEALSILDSLELGEGGTDTDTDLIVIFQHFTNLNVANPHPFGAFLPEGALVELIGQTDPAENGTYVAPANAGSNPLVLADDQILSFGNIGRQVTVLRAINGPYVYGPLEWIVATSLGGGLVFSPQSGTTLFVQGLQDWEFGAFGNVDFDGALSPGALVLSVNAPGSDNGVYRFVADGSPMVRSLIEAGVGTTVRVMAIDAVWILTPHSGWVDRTPADLDDYVLDTALTTTLADYALDATVDTDRVASNLGDALAAQAQEFAGELTNVFRFDGNQTSRWSTPNLTAQFTTGIEIRAVIIPRRFSAGWYHEILTQAHDAGAGAWDNFELAILDNDAPRYIDDDSVAEVPTGKAILFWEQTLTGGSAESGSFFGDGGLQWGNPAEVMVDINFSATRRRLWVRVPYNLGDGATYHTSSVDGALFRLVRSEVTAEVASLDAHTEVWWLGQQFGGDIARVTARDGLDGDLIANPDAAQVDVRATLDPAENVPSFTDGAGNVWTGGTASEIVDFRPEPWYMLPYTHHYSSDDYTISASDVGTIIEFYAPSATVDVIIPDIDPPIGSLIYLYQTTAAMTVSVVASDNAILRTKTGSTQLDGGFSTVSLRYRGTAEWVLGGDLAGGGGSGTVDVVSNVAQNRIVGRIASGSGDSEELTAAQVRSLLGVDWRVISDQTLESEGMFTFPDITGYSEIEITVTGRWADTAVASAGVRLRFNGDTGNNYMISAGSATSAFNNNGNLPASQTNTDRRGRWQATFTLGGGGVETVGQWVNTFRTSTATTGSALSQGSLFYTNTSAAITAFEIYAATTSDLVAGSRMIVRAR
jgi:hypothetical protein